MKVFLTILGAILLAVAVAAIEAWVFMLLWNWIAVGLFTAPELSFWAAWGVLILLNVVGNLFHKN